MGKNCKSCGYWDFPNKETYADNMGLHGQCLKALMYDPGDEKTEYKKEPVITMDGSGYMAILLTLPTHCCSEWKQNDKQNDQRN